MLIDFFTANMLWDVKIPDRNSNTITRIVEMNYTFKAFTCEACH